MQRSFTSFCLNIACDVANIYLHLPRHVEMWIKCHNVITNALVQHEHDRKKKMEKIHYKWRCFGLSSEISLFFVTRMYTNFNDFHKILEKE